MPNICVDIADAHAAAARGLAALILLMMPCLAVGSGVAATAGPEHSPFIWALIGDRMDQLDAERKAGITARVVRISWKDFEPSPTSDNEPYIDQKQREFDQLHAAGFQIIADIGLQDTPSWLHETYPDSYYVDQFGDIYKPGEVDSGDANLVFNATLRAAAKQYLDRLLGALGSRIDFVRIGGGHWGELTYPSAHYSGHANCYWGFDRNALESNPSPDWRPGDGSPHDEASHFINWYLDQLADFQNWQIGVIRHGYGGPIIVLYPSWGIRPGQLDAAIADNLSGATSSEKNGEVPRGFDFARQIQRIDDTNIIVASTWLDANGSGDDGPDQTQWSPVHYLAELATRHRPALRLFGENTGHGTAAALGFTVSQARRFGLCGFAWFREAELNQPGLATLGDIHNIARTPTR
jgi:hypothetical protein